MLLVTEILAIIVFHYIADFIFQDEKWATGKSKNIKDLVSHTSVYSILMTFFISFLFFTNGEIVSIPYGITTKIPLTKSICFGFVTFVLHTLTDYFTSEIVSKKFSNGHYGSPIPNFGAFSLIGFDQVLHYFQLFLTYYLLK